ncbi:uncharacterized protein [Nicotiana tomentosiformis]|uniref:uncharacterized protein n=1 Tax=Nicotiana tomentosiformis TaxID=4098 RepID=UPI00388C6A86
MPLTTGIKAVTSAQETQGQRVLHESTVVEENRVLKQQMTEMCQAWANGQGPPFSIHGFPEFTSISTTTIPVSLPDQSYPPGFSLYPNCMTTTETSVARSQSVPLTTNQTTTNVIPVFTIPQPTVVQKKTHESQFATQQEQYHSPEYHSYLFDLPAKIENPARKMAQEEMTQRMKSLEQPLKNMQGLAGKKSVAFKDLCMFPDVRLPLGFKIPKFEKYDGHGDPIAHLKRYCNQLRGAGRNEELLMAYFGESLTGVASEWFMDQETSHWHVWDDMAQAFVKQFQYNIDITLDRNSFSNLKKKPTESFRVYAIKWREQAARVKPPMDDHKLITVFLQAQEPDYFQNMMSAVGKSFSEAIKIGEMVENGLKTGKIISQAVLKAATQAVQIEFDNFSDTNEKDGETMMTIRSRRGPRRTSRRYEQPHQVSDDSPEHYYPPQNPQYSIAPLQYVVQPPRHPRRRAPAPQNFHQLPQNFQVPYNPHPSQGYKGEQRLKDNFTPIGESYASGHNVESCRDLKREIERMIQEKLIVIQDNDTQNIMQNPLYAHDDAHFVGMMCGDMEYENPLGNLPTEIGEDHGDSNEQICG